MVDRVAREAAVLDHVTALLRAARRIVRLTAAALEPDVFLARAAEALVAERCFTAVAFAYGDTTIVSNAALDGARRLVVVGTSPGADLLRRGGPFDARFVTAPIADDAVDAAHAPLGTLVVELPAGIFDDADERARIRDVAADLAFALAASKRDVERAYNDELLEATARTAKVGGWRIDTRDGSGRWTNEVSRIHDLDDADAVGLARGLDYFEEKSAVRVREAIARTIAEGIPYDLELELVSAKGVKKWVRAISTPIIENGRVVHLRGTLQDITAQKTTEISLNAERARLQTLFDTIPDLVWLKDPQGVFLQCNARFERLLGATQAEIRGKTDYDFVPKEVADFFRENDRIAIERGKPVRNEEWVTFQDDGHREFLETTKAPVHGPDGAVIGVLGVGRDVTAAREAQEVLKQRLELQDQIARFTATAPGLVAAVRRDADGTFSMPYASARIEEIYGVTLAEVAHDLSPLADRFHAADARRVLDDALASATTLTLGQYELRYAHPRRGEIWLEILAMPRAEADGSHIWDTFVHDITSRKRVEETLRLQTSALQIAGAGVVISDTAGTIEWVNDAFTMLTGFDAVDVVGRNVSFLQSRCDDPTAYGHVRPTLLAGRTWYGEQEVRRKDGRRFHEGQTVTPVRDDDGAITHFVAIKQDITARKAADEALRASEERYRVLVDSLDDVVFASGVDGRVTFINRAVSRFGYAPADVIGRRLDDFVHPEDRSALHLGISSNDSDASLVPHELRLLDARGRYRAVRSRIRARVVRDEVIGTTGVLVDLTLQRETEEQLRAAQKMEAVGRLAGGIAHDFNNLLTVILSNTELMTSELDPSDPMFIDLTEVAEAAQRAEGLTRQLLAFSRRQILKPEPLELTTVVESLGNMLRRVIGEDIDLRLASGANVYRTKVDRGQIEQVVLNLVVNARDAMPDGGRVTISTANVHVDAARAPALDVAPGFYVEVTVEDTGCGMPEAILPRIFEPFFTTKDVGKGTGLGLAMAYGIVKQSGGGIVVESTVGIGTTFRLLLPRFDGAVAVSPSAPPPKAPARGFETILVVEDEWALRNVVRRVLVAAGYDVLVAASAGEAMLLSETHGPRIHLVFTDVVMPGVNGRELAERLAPLCPAARVLFTSGYTDDAIARHGVLGKHFLPKPFDRVSLTAKIRTVLDAP